MRQLRPETGESLPIFQNTDPIVFVLFISLFLTFFNQRGYQRQYFWTVNLKVLAISEWTRSEERPFTYHYDK